MRALLGPTNFANQPALLARALRDRKVDARHILYAWGGRVPFDYGVDRVVELDRENWLERQLATVNRALEEGVEVFHLWNRSLVYEPGGYGFFSGLDLPYLKASGAKVIYRFTGYELRRRSLDKELNPYSPYHAGLELQYDEETQARYLDHLRQWVDRFVVQDPEMGTFMPEATRIPRGIDLSSFKYVGARSSERPLVVHAPSKRNLKGSEHVLAAVETLREQNLSFDFELIEDTAHSEAVDVYRRADIVIDQLLIGWYGVVAVEAMALGKPVIAYIREPLYEEFTPELPIVNATVETLAGKLAELVMDPDLRADVGVRSRQFAEEVHDIRAVAEQTAALYGEVAASQTNHSKPRPSYMRDLAPGPVSAMNDAAQWGRVRDELPELRQKARLHDRVSGELPDLRQKAALYDRVVEELPELRRKARAYERIEDELPELRYKARVHDEMKDELPELRQKARIHDRIKDELPELRQKARIHDRLKEELPALRQKARMHDELVEEVEDLRTGSSPSAAPDEELRELRKKARLYDRIAEELPELRQKARRYDRLKDELADLRRKARNYDVTQETLPELRQKAKRYDEIKDRLPELRFKAERYELMKQHDD